MSKATVNFDQEGFSAPDLTDDDAVRALPQSLANEVTKCDRRSPVETLVSCLHLGHVRKIGIDLEHLFARHDATVRRHFAQQAVDQGRLPCPGRPGNHDREVVAHGEAQQIRCLRSQRPSGHEVVEPCCPQHELPDLDIELAGVGHRRTGDMEPAAVCELCRDDR